MRGMNDRLTNIQAAIGLAQAERIEYAAAISATSRASISRGSRGSYAPTNNSMIEPLATGLPDRISGPEVRRLCARDGR
jgi:hypothetical protein